MRAAEREIAGALARCHAALAEWDPAPEQPPHVLVSTTEDGLVWSIRAESRVLAIGRRRVAPIIGIASTLLLAEALWRDGLAAVLAATGRTGGVVVSRAADIDARAGLHVPADGG